MYGLQIKKFFEEGGLGGETFVHKSFFPQGFNL